MNKVSKTSIDEKLTPILSGVAGEYFVAAELSRRGYIASITLRNSRGVDILASNSEATKSVAIQVKTNQGSKRKWLMNQKAEKFFSKNHFYIFVNLNGMSSAPDYFIVPSTVASKHILTDHANWLKTPGRKGQSHKDTNMRVFDDPNGKYQNRWDLLGL